MTAHTQIIALAGLKAAWPSRFDQEKSLALHATTVKSIMGKFEPPFGNVAQVERVNVALQNGVVVSEQKPLLWIHSEFFRAVARFKTMRQDRALVLLDDFTTEDWAAFATWLQEVGGMGTVKLLQGRVVSESTGSDEFWADEMTRLASAWLFGEYICAPAFQNDLIECLVNLYFSYIRHHSQIPIKHMQFIVKKTFEGSKLWSLLQDVIKRAYHIGHLTLTNDVEDLLEDLDLNYILEYLRRGQFASRLINKDMDHQRLYCFYRVHRRGQDSFRYHKNRDVI